MTGIVPTPEIRSEGGVNSLWWSRGRFLVPVVSLLTIAAGFAVLFIPRWILEMWVPKGTPADAIKASIGPATQAVLLTLGGVIAAITVGLSLSRRGQEVVSARHAESLLAFDREKERQRITEVLAAQRVDEQRALRARFVSAVDLLSHQEPISRTAGIYALAALADDWMALDRPDERQVAVDVLCGYLRSPMPSDTREVAVRQTAWEVIEAHLQADSVVNWRGMRFPLRSSPLPYRLRLRNIDLGVNTTLDMAGVKVGGQGVSVTFYRTTIGPGSRLDLAAAVVEDEARLDISFPRVLEGALLSLHGARIRSDGEVELQRVIAQGVVDLGAMTITKSGGLLVKDSLFEGKGSKLTLQNSHIDAGNVDLHRVTFSEEGTLQLNQGELGFGGVLVIGAITVRSGGRVYAPGFTVGVGGAAVFGPGRIEASAVANLSEVIHSDAGVFRVDPELVVEPGAAWTPPPAP